MPYWITGLVSSEEESEVEKVFAFDEAMEVNYDTEKLMFLHSSSIT
jgi:hypothetical protein